MRYSQKRGAQQVPRVKFTKIFSYCPLPLLCVCILSSLIIMVVDMSSFEKSVSSQERNYIQQVQILLVDDKGHIVRVLYLALSAAVNSWVAHPRISPFSDKKFPPLRSLCSALRQFRFLESSFSYFHVNVTHCTSFCPGERTALCSNLISLDLFIFFSFPGKSLRNLQGQFSWFSSLFPLLLTR